MDKEDMKKLMKEYNHNSSLMMISPYPKKGEFYSSGTSGIASYAKNVASRMNKKVIVLGNCLKKPEIYEEKNVLVVRCFKNNSITLWFSLLKNIFLLNNVKNIKIHYDFALYGSFFISSLVIPFLAILKVLGKNITFVPHSVITDVFELSGHVGLKNNLLDHVKGRLYNAFFHLFYSLVGVFADKIIVTEQPLVNKLSRFINVNKITAIPHGVDSSLKPMPKKKARELLALNQKDFVVMFFGYINWFKGADFFANTFKDTKKILGRNTHFIFAGGVSPTMKDKEHYKKYFTEITKTICDSPVMNMTGYINQKDIGSYFSAADLVVFPYRSFMSASGVLSLIFSYQKPFIISDKLKHMFESSDFQYAFRASKLDEKDIVFNLEKKSFIKSTERILENGIKKKTINMAKTMKNIRDYKYVAMLYEDLIFSPSYKLNKTYSLNYNLVS